MRTPSVIRAIALLLGLFAFSASSYAHWNVGVSVAFAPPPLPLYVQPLCPGNGYLWTPGYWGYDGDDEDGYYWVPGTWVLAPRPGLLWTPGYWGAEGAYFAWHAGYWGPQVGFYGGIDYGFGYFGIGFAGGYWRDHDFVYNRAVTNVTNVSVTSVSVTNVYNNTGVNNQGTNSRVSYNGGPAGTRRRPSSTEEAAKRASNFGATNEQRRHELAARSTPALRLAANHGMPPIAATPRPGVFLGRGLTTARGSVGTAPSASRSAMQGRADVVANHGSSGTLPYSFATPGGRSESPQARQAGNAPRADRPSWASRGTTPVAAVHSSTTRMPAALEAAPYRQGASYQYRASTRSDYSARYGQRTPTATRPEARAPASSDAHNYGYPTARASAPRYAPSAHLANAYQYRREPAHPAYAQRATVSPRESARAPSVSAPHPAGNSSTPRPYSAARDQSAAR